MMILRNDRNALIINNWIYVIIMDGINIVYLNHRAYIDRFKFERFIYCPAILLFVDNDYDHINRNITRYISTRKRERERRKEIETKQPVHYSIFTFHRRYRCSNRKKERKKTRVCVCWTIPVMSHLKFKLDQWSVFVNRIQWRMQSNCHYSHHLR